MELRHLRYFVAVAELQNIHRAATKLHVSQPPLSRQIRDLEDELGVALFEHNANSLRLTEAGRAFLPEARAALQRVDDAVLGTTAWENVTVGATVTGLPDDLFDGVTLVTVGVKTPVGVVYTTSTQ